MMERRLFEDAEGVDPTSGEPESGELLRGTTLITIGERHLTRTFQTRLATPNEGFPPAN